MCKEWLRTVGHFEQGWGRGPWGYWSGSSVVRWRVTVMVTVTCGVFYQWLNRTVHEKLCCVSVVLIQSLPRPHWTWTCLFTLVKNVGLVFRWSTHPCAANIFYCSKLKTMIKHWSIFLIHRALGSEGCNQWLSLLIHALFVFIFPFLMKYTHHKAPKAQSDVLNVLFGPTNSNQQHWNHMHLFHNNTAHETVNLHIFLKHPNERMFVIFVLVKHIFRRGGGLKSMWFVKSYNFPVVKIHQHVKTLHGKNINTWSPLIFPTQWIYSSLFSSTLAAWLRYFSVIIHQRELSTAVNQDKRTRE